MRRDQVKAKRGRKRYRVHPLVAWGYYTVAELKALPPGRRDEILSALEHIRAGRRHSQPKRALLKALDPSKFGDPSGGQAKPALPSNSGVIRIRVAETAGEKLGYDPATHVETISKEESAELDAKYAELAAEADKRLGLTDGAVENSEEPSHMQADLNYVDRTAPPAPKQSREPEIGSLERAFFNTPGYPTGHSPSRFKDEGFVW